ncbi:MULTISPECIES: class I SAM-dependent methyltransferase [unclassified Mesorhizobium]|uniref:class I SAM-dependent methyltransferase n=1 Tax=unclassified Mesorhizobium TaxID=325217 RepID=UPI000FCBA644|nr:MULTISPECIES: class I SAM-dependent methyltransferase [unclassified Mesorhizobium]RUX96610.1 class I SAM-dependent methyltransferase [Mesorhizobium sp. M7D.F.Ca.US.004.01.2.1]RVA22169.1 class I SAM-dependent methyltransferase [Mesorhizobium sp. M7D.F.Ca.US.004.03.1.1]
MQEHSVFLKTVVDPIQGWLVPYTAIRSMDLLEWQITNGVRGGLFEIGVFCGKYLSVLLQSANATGEAIVGVDTFEAVPQNQVLDLLGRNGANSDRVQLIQGKSVDVSAADILGRLDGAARFISIDGSHEKSDVLSDLRLCDEILSDQGIISADDFLNCLCLGVTEAIFEYLKDHKSIVPFCYLPNKLLLCRKSMASTYTSVLEQANNRSPFDGIGKRVAETAAQDRSKIFTAMAGSKVLVLS